MIKLTPLGDRILVKKIQKEKVEKKGSIYIPDQDKHESIITCLVEKVSESRDEKSNIHFKEGEKVLLEKHMGNKYKINDEEYYIVSIEHILAKIED
jgi:chaperonin GroES